MSDVSDDHIDWDNLNADPERLGALLLTFYETVRRTVLKQLSEKARAQADPSQVAGDVLYSVFSDIYKHNRKVQGRDDFENMILQKAVRRAVDAARRAGAKPRDFRRKEPGADLDLVASSIASPDADLAVSELSECVLAIIDKEFTAEEREVILLVLFSDFTYAQAADAVNEQRTKKAINEQRETRDVITENMVDHLIRRARAVIKRELTRRFP